MLKCKIKAISLLVFILCLFMAAGTFAKVSADKAARLGQDLTPVGAEKAGNADGTIPEWTGGMTGVPEGIKFIPGTLHPDPFADEKPLFKITAANVGKHADKLGEGCKDLIKRFPDTFYVPVYPTHRTAAFPDWWMSRSKRNATLIEMSEDKLGVLNQGVTGGTPFPIPTCGEEVMYNALLRWRGTGRRGDYQRANVFPNGKFTRNGGGYAWEKYPWNIEGLDAANWDGNYYELITRQDYPARRKGELLLVKDPLNQSKTPRKAWQYLPGQRRVRRAPTVAYDTPNPGASGLETYDDAFVFNGALDRFDWKIVGKKEAYIPYNCYHCDLVPEKELLTGNHPNPEALRFELHRVWVIEATLKKGKRHVYGRRIFFADEDSWVLLTQDMFDRRGKLWRYRFSNAKSKYNISAVVQRAEFFFDITRKDYGTVETLNDVKNPMRNDVLIEDSYFTPENLRRMGRR